MAQPRLNLKNVTSLLVDRDNFTRGLIAQMLRGFGMEPPLLAGSGAEAKAFLESSLPDILFLEGALPDMTAAELIGWIRRQSKKNLRFVPIIVLSGYTQMRLISAARDGGAQYRAEKTHLAANPVRPYPVGGAHDTALSGNIELCRSRPALSRRLAARRPIQTRIRRAAGAGSLRSP